jgi:hypothetical protein
VGYGVAEAHFTCVIRILVCVKLIVLWRNFGCRIGCFARPTHLGLQQRKRPQTCQTCGNIYQVRCSDNSCNFVLRILSSVPATASGNPERGVSVDTRQHVPMNGRRMTSIQRCIWTADDAIHRCCRSIHFFVTVSVRMAQWQRCPSPRCMWLPPTETSNPANVEMTHRVCSYCQQVS